jgi:DNA-binding IclR family transcriptional regulator
VTAQPEDSGRRNGLQLISRAADVLRALEQAPDGLTQSEIALSLGLAKSTAHRLVGALQDEDFVKLGEDGRWRLGRGLAQLGAAARDTLREELRPYLVRLGREVDETVDLSLLHGDGMRFIDQVPSTRRLVAVSAVGVTFPLHCTANGKAFLAALPQDHAAALLPPRLAAHTAATITSRRALWTELEVVRATGVAFDREEHTEGICAVGAVVRDAYGLAAAISIAAPTQRFTGEEEQLVQRLLAVCGEASHDLGG